MAVHREAPSCPKCGEKIKGIWKTVRDFVGDTFVKWDYSGHVCHIPEQFGQQLINEFNEKQQNDSLPMCSDKEIEAAALKALPVEMHRGKLDINAHVRKSWVDGAKYQRDQMALDVFHAYQRYAVIEWKKIDPLRLPADTIIAYNGKSFMQGRLSLNEVGRPQCIEETHEAPRFMHYCTHYMLVSDLMDVVKKK